MPRSPDATAEVVRRRRRAGATPLLSDDELVARARTGDHTAFGLLLRRHDSAMRRLAFRLLADATAMDDVLQDAYLRAFRALSGFRQGAQFGSWLYRITYNACIDELRRARRRPLAMADTPERATARPGPERAVTATELVRSALAALPADQRVAVVLVDGEGFDSRSAARILGVPVGTVASRLSRARGQLRRMMEGDADGNR